ncbi:MAG: outer membrane protein assembly factor BamE [Cyclobacteriaceae bacterium]|nr:outer membrane protein assembly factor BamE [Cyclobacteriaceae bacterium]
MTKYISIFLLIFLSYCTSSLTIDGFDKKGWTNDKDGCLGNRKDLIDLVMANKEILMGKDQNQIKSLLGRPDMHEIYKRAQRFYIYSLDPGSSCGNYIADKKLANLTLRFNALGRVHEVVYYE